MNTPHRFPSVARNRARLERAIARSIKAHHMLNTAREEFNKAWEQASLEVRQASVRYMLQTDYDCSNNAAEDVFKGMDC